MIDGKEVAPPYTGTRPVRCQERVEPATGKASVGDFCFGVNAVYSQSGVIPAGPISGGPGNFSTAVEPGDTPVH